jgi:hypothetical protein
VRLSFPLSGSRLAQSLVHYKYVLPEEQTYLLRKKEPLGLVNSPCTTQSTASLCTSARSDACVVATKDTNLPCAVRGRAGDANQQVGRRAPAQ